MSLTDHVTITITAETLGVPRSGFGIPMILSVNAAFPERIRFYDSIGAVADDFASTTSPEYLAARAMLSQNPHPELIAIGRAVGKPTQRYAVSLVNTTPTVSDKFQIVAKGDGVTETTVTYTTLADFTFVDGDVTVGTDTIAETAHGMTTGDGPYRVSNSGGALPTGLAADTDYWIIAPTIDTFKFASSKANALALTAVDITAAAGGGTHTVRRNQNDVVIAQLVQGLNAAVGKNFTAAQVPGAGETDTMTVTGDAAGEWFSLEVTTIGFLKIAQDHAEPGTTLATDLDAIANENKSWYALYTLYNSDAYVKAAAAWTESQKRIYMADLSMSETPTLADSGSDTADDLQTSGYDRTAMAYHPSPASMLGAAWLGTRLPYDPGSETWKFASPSGVAAVTLTATHKVNLRTKSVNTLETIGGTNRMWEGKVASGEFIDVIRGLDWLENDMQTGVYNALAGALKVPFTDAGIALIENEVIGSLQRGVQQGLLASDPAPVVQVPKAVNVATADKSIRTLPDVRFSATLAGAVHKVQVVGVVSV